MTPRSASGWHPTFSETRVRFGAGAPPIEAVGWMVPRRHRPLNIDALRLDRRAWARRGLVQGVIPALQATAWQVLVWLLLLLRWMLQMIL